MKLLQRDFGLIPDWDVVAKLVSEGRRVGKAPWCCDSTTEDRAATILAHRYGITACETMEETVTRRKNEVTRRKNERKSKEKAPDKTNGQSASKEPKDKTYEAMGKKLGNLVDRKQAAYGDSFGRSGQVLRALYPNGIAPEQYDDVLAIARIVDKLFRVATQRDAFDESPGHDIAGYGLLMARRHMEEKRERMRKLAGAKK